MTRSYTADIWFMVIYLIHILLNRALNYKEMGFAKCILLYYPEVNASLTTFKLALKRIHIYGIHLLENITWLNLNINSIFGYV